ncbi:pyridoxal phosphate-dependent decarboxylase family protein [Kitasatospora sp. NPDC054768]
MDLRYWLPRAAEVAERWGERFGPLRPHPSHLVDEADFAAAFERFAKRLEHNYPFFHPRYAGQMVKPPHPAAVVGYLTAMRFNPNNHAYEGGPATNDMERECVAQLAAMFALPAHVGHLTSSGTIANLEALYVARQSHPGLGVAHSAQAHYTHSRMCHVLGVESHAVAADAEGRMDVGALEELLRTGRVGTVVVTCGTTGPGAVDPVHEILPLARRYGARVHVDAAYGGFFALLAADDALAASLGVDTAPWRAVAGCDSVTVDPHKHGLQPYGCGAVLFADPGIGRHFAHDSPYTYFTDAELHLGEISLECSRAGASAAALWLTLQLLPLTPEGLGAGLAASRRAALTWAELIDASEELTLHQWPQLDILTYFPTVPGTPAPALSAIDAASEHVLRRGMADERDPVYLSVLRVDAADFTRRHPGVRADAGGARVLRSVLIKPEAEEWVEPLHARVTALAAAAGAATRPSPDAAGTGGAAAASRAAEVTAAPGTTDTTDVTVDPPSPSSAPSFEESAR